MAGILLALCKRGEKRVLEKLAGALYQRVEQTSSVRGRRQLCEGV